MLDIFKDYKNETVNGENFLISEKTLCAICYEENQEIKFSDIKRLEFLLLDDFSNVNLILFDIEPRVDNKGTPFLLLYCDLIEHGDLKNV